MKLAIMQPYFFPYLGYFQLIHSADTFVIYDNIKYTKKGWINRNRILQNGTDVPFSLPLKKASDSLDVCERDLAPDFVPGKLLNQIRGAYARAPHFAETFTLLEKIINHGERGLFPFIHNSIVQVCAHLKIQSKILVSSEINADHSLKAEERVLAICKAVGAKTYINASGGKELYSADDFAKSGIDLKFIQPKLFIYPQFSNDFVPWLSIVDVMMFNSKRDVIAAIGREFELVGP